MNDRPKKKPMYVGITMRGAVYPDEWQRIVQAIDVAVSNADPAMKLTMLTAYVDENKVAEIKR